ncbi:type VII secretion-associated serine protease mycosin [Streptomyces sp. So13.3]|uniref:type VII secretion-associated serine protease mycosin n=1 Tax=unclassified Streptomyces TaxID=2593676 RepID=UPI00110710F3|nr:MULTISPECIES: type VII secretion-associated serine protease mycosin [unclassified Streptomyces]MCZ4100251.1 type VII secretion-associated serine protease mycosin [Streptomyces sp. H39-C1]QNA75690.1 type VII secretion-associated serine protease mycosin [Streptomyces sp. So13.3]
MGSGTTHELGLSALTSGVAAFALLAGPAAPPVTAGLTAAAEITLAADGECTFPAKDIKGTPWSLQRVLLNQLWQDTKGKGVRVAVIDTGVDATNPQLKSAVDVAHGVDVIGGKDHGANDTVGHGTKVAGIIAARPLPGTGFTGIAPEATIIPIRQNDNQGAGRIPSMVRAIDAAVAAHARVINISQDTSGDVRELAQAIHRAVAANVVVVVAAGNAGADGKLGTTFPGAYEGVLAVGASDRNNERASFSQAGTFVGVSAPGVDMVSTVPKGGQCVDNGTSFSAPYVAGVAALIRAKHPAWRAHEVIAQIEQTAQRTSLGHNDFTGWGVVDPVRALTDDAVPIAAPVADPGVAKGDSRVIPATLTLGETPQQRDQRVATYVLGLGVVLSAAISGSSVALRDLRRRRRFPR